MMAVLAYHKVDNKFELGMTIVKPEMFFRQIAALKECGYEISGAAGQATAGERSVCLTFDDGYDCFYRNVVPFLISVRAKAIVFVITDFIGKENRWDLRLSYAPFVHMNESQLKEISTLGFEVGSHSCSHRDLTRLNRRTVYDELVNSKRVIEELTGREVKTISFPYGKHNSDVVALAHEAGYTTQFGLGSVALSGVIERIPVYRIDTPASVRRKVTMDRLEILKSDLIHSFANISALISVRHKEKAA